MRSRRTPGFFAFEDKCIFLQTSYCHALSASVIFHRTCRCLRHCLTPQIGRTQRLADLSPVHRTQNPYTTTPVCPLDSCTPDSLTIVGPLTSIFYIDVAAFAVTSNHYHLALHFELNSCQQADPKEIVVRRHQLHRPKEVSLKLLTAETLEPHEQYQLDTWRSRLHNISWCMKVLSENIARMANKEDECTGHFWEPRLRSRALLDEKAVLSATAYVDLNFVRAAMASTTEMSDHTCIRLRVEHWKNKASEMRLEDRTDYQPKSLLPFAANSRQPMPVGLALNLIDYTELVDWTVRVICDDKHGFIPETATPILQRLGISAEHWVELSTHFVNRYKGLVGSVNSVEPWRSRFGLTIRAHTHRQSQ